MTVLGVFLAGITLVVLPGLAGPPLTMRAAEWARVAGASLLGGFVAIEASLVLLFLPTLLRALHAAGVAEICAHVLTPFTPGGSILGWLAGAVAVVIGVRALRAGRRALRSARDAEVEPWLGRHEDRGDFELVVIPTRELIAVSVPTARPQVVVSDGLVECLDNEHLDAVLRHEASHHRCRHWRYAVVGVAVDQGLRPLPLVARSRRALALAVEAWADDDAVGNVPRQRAVVRDAIRVVFAGRRMPGRNEAATARERTRRLEFGAIGTTFAMRATVLTPVLVAGTAATFLLAGWVLGMHHALGVPGYCAD